MLGKDLEQHATSPAAQHFARAFAAHLTRRRRLRMGEWIEKVGLIKMTYAVPRAKALSAWRVAPTWIMSLGEHMQQPVKE